MFSVQSMAQSPFQMGIKVTSNHSNIAGNLENLSKSTALRFSAGITTKYTINKLFLQTDLLYSESKSDIENIEVNQAKWKSIDLPIALGYTILDLNQFKVHVLAGGTYSQIIDNTLNFNDNLKNIDSNFSKKNIQAKVGAGISIGKVTFDLSYSRSLNNLSKDFKSKSNNIQLGVSYLFL
jgi:predicted porin